MFVLTNLVLAVAWLVDWLLFAYFWIIIARVVISWIGADRYHPIVTFVHRVTEPVLRPIRERLPITMGFDFSPMVVVLAILFLERFLVSSLRDLAYSVR